MFIRKYNKKGCLCNGQQEQWVTSPECTGPGHAVAPTRLQYCNKALLSHLPGPGTALVGEGRGKEGGNSDEGVRSTEVYVVGCFQFDVLFCVQCFECFTFFWGDKTFI